MLLWGQDHIFSIFMVDVSVVKEVSSQVLYLRFLEPTSRGHPNCFRVEWGSLRTVENNKCRDGGHKD